MNDFAKKNLTGVIWALVFGGLYLTTLYNYLLFHALAEMFRIAVAAAIFMLVWNVRRSLDNNYLLFIGVAYLFIGGLDLVHTLAHKGMGIFVGYGANLPSQLWIGARYLESISLLCAAFFFGRLANLKIILAGYVIATSLFLASIFYGQVFPICYVEGAGSTPFRKLSEYAVIFIFAAAFALLVKQRDQFEPSAFRFLAVSLAFNVLSEICFSFYSDAIRFPYFLGHCLKVISFYCIYRAIIETGIAKPFSVLFRNLKKSEDALQREHDFVAGVLSTQDVMVLVLDRDGRIVRVNDAGGRLTGYSDVEMRGKLAWDLVNPGEAEELQRLFRESISMKVPIRRESSLVAKDNRLLWVLWSSTFLLDEKGAVEYIVVSGIDITERKRAEESLRESQRLFQKLAQVSPVGIFRTDPNGDCIYVNERWQEIAGISAEQALGRGWASAIHPEDRDKVTAEWYSSAQKKLPFKLEYRFRRPDDATTWVMGQATAETNDAGRVTGYVGTITDISEIKKAEMELSGAFNELDIRVQARTRELAETNELLRQEIKERLRVEEALRKSESKYRIVADNTYDWEWWRDSEGNFIYVSPSCQKITDHQVDEFMADSDLLLRIIHPDDRPSFLRHQTDVEEKVTSGEIEFRILLPDRSIRWLAHACQPVFDENGRLQGRRGSNRDISERKRAEEALRESEKQLRFLSTRLLTAQETERKRISRELHDELGGGLAVLKLRMSFIERNLQVEEDTLRVEFHQCLQYTDQMIENVSRLSRDLSPSVLEDIGLTPALRRLFDNFANNYKIRVVSDIIDLGQMIPKNSQIMIYRIFQEALTNIGKHAQAKRVTIQVRRDEERISFSLEDDGKGFDPQQVTAKKASEKGLGLVIMDERARMLGGTFDLRTKEGKGTRITFSIPIGGRLSA